MHVTLLNGYVLALLNSKRSTGIMLCVQMHLQDFARNAADVA
jgi:hypothetical protein